MYYQNYNNRGNGLWVFLILFILFGGFRLFFLLFGTAIALIINFFPLIIGGVILYTISKRIRKNATVNSTLNTHTPEHKRFVELTIHILVHLIKADGTIDPRETQFIKSFFQNYLNFNHAQLIWIEDTLQDSLKKAYPLGDLCDEFRSNFQFNGRRMIVELMYRVAFSDGKLHPHEDIVIQDVVRRIGLSDDDHAQIRVLFVKEDDRTKYYTLLGIQKGASKSEIKKAYREASKKYHPDRVHHLGDEFQKVAQEKMQEINQAYQVLSKG